MKQLFPILLLVTALLTACAPLPAEPGPVADTEATTSSLPPHSELFLPGIDTETLTGWFCEVCLDAEIVNSGNPGRLQKWTAPLTYRVRGQPSEEDLETLSAFAALANTIPGFPGIREVDENPALDIFFCTHEEMAATLGEWAWSCDGGTTFWYEEDRIHSAIICIRTDLDQPLRNSVVLEELYNVLGPIQDTESREDSIIYAGFSEPQWLTEVDILILKLLYHPDMEPGMDREQCTQIIQKLYY